MCCTVEGQVHGVLTDYDLSLWTASQTPDRSGTPQQRTGTPLFMANGLLCSYDPDGLHLYRHDAESIFYVMLILTTHYEIQAPKELDGEGGGIRMKEGNLSFQDWFNIQNYNTLGAIKSTFIMRAARGFEVSRSFKDFRLWLLQLRMSFANGSWAKSGFLLDQMELSPGNATSSASSSVSFDEETLGGHITYSALINPIRYLKGELEGLVIRYDPSPQSSPTSTSAAQADA